MLRIGAHGDFRLEVLLLERPRQLSSAVLQMLEVLAVRQQIENKNLHQYLHTYRVDSILTQVRVMGACGPPGASRCCARASLRDRSRDSHCWPPPPQIPAYGTTVPGSCLAS